MLGSETRMSFPPVPPSPPPPPEKRYVAVIAVAIATGILVVGSLMLFVGTAPGDAEPKVAADADEESILSAAQQAPGVQPWVAGKQVKKRLYVPQKLVNIVVA